MTDYLIDAAKHVTAADRLLERAHQEMIAGASPDSVQSLAMLASAHLKMAHVLALLNAEEDLAAMKGRR